MIRVTNGAGAVERRRYILDAMDPQDYSTNVAGSVGYYRQGGPVQGNGAQTVCWDAAASWLAEAGARNLGMVWAAAVSAAATLKTRSATRWQLPIGFDVGSMAQVGGEGFWPMRFRVETILWRVTNPLIAAAPVSFCCSWTGGSLAELSNNTFPGVELVSRSDLNGGNWTARARLAGGGALVQIENTGISPQGAGPMHLELRYDHKAVPRLSWFINGQEWGVMEGLANLPVGSSSLQVTGLAQGLSVGGGAGQLDRQRQTRIRIQELPGFPD